MSKFSVKLIEKIRSYDGLRRQSFFQSYDNKMVVDRKPNSRDIQHKKWLIINDSSIRIKNAGKILQKCGFINHLAIETYSLASVPSTLKRELCSFDEE